MSERHDDRIALAIRRAADAVPPIELAEVTSRGPVDLDPVADGLVTDDGLPAHAVSATRRYDMVIDLERTEELGAGGGAPPPRRRSWRLLAAAAAVLAVVAGVGLATDGGDARVDVAPAGPDDGDRDVLARATQQVDDFLAVYNADDPESLAAAMVSNMVTDGYRSSVKPVFDAAGERWERVGPCRLDGGTGVVCPIRREDDFHGAAGLAIEEDHVFRFGEDGRLTRFVLLDAEPWAQHWAFRSEFRRWVETTRPDAGIEWFGGQGSTSEELVDMPRAHSMTAAVELVDDFVASSDRWPV